MPVCLRWLGEGMPNCLECQKPTESLNYQWEKDKEHGWLCKECYWSMFADIQQEIRNGLPIENIREKIREKYG